MFHYIQQGHTYASASQIFLITLDSVQKWVARYKKYGIEGLQTKTILGRPSLNDAKDNDKTTLMQTTKKGGRVRLKDI